MNILFLKASWKFLVGAAIGGIMVWVLLSWLNTRHIDRLNAAHQVALQTQSDQLVKECQNDKAITAAASQSYQDALADTRSELDRLKRVRPSVMCPRRRASCRPRRRISCNRQARHSCPG